MDRYTRIGEKLIQCSGCSEIVSVPVEYEGNLCPSCEDTNPNSIQGNSLMKQTKKYLMRHGDNALMFWKMLVEDNTYVSV